VAYGVAATLLAHDCASTIVRQFLQLPDGESERQALLRSALTDADPDLPISVTPRTHAGWFDMCGDISVVAPGLNLLLTDVLGAHPHAAWSPGQVLDITRASSRVSPTLEGHGFHPTRNLGGVGSQFAAFLNVARGHEAYVFIDKGVGNT